MDKKTDVNPIWENLYVMMLPSSERTLTFGDEFFLADNFGIAQGIRPSRFTTPNYPFKINFTMIIFCTKGYMKVRLNLEEFCLSAGQAMTVLPGSIGECVEFGRDFQAAFFAFSNTDFLSNIDSSYAVMFQKYLMRQPVIQLTEADLNEQITLYRMMREKMLQPNFRFLKEALSGYMQVLVSNGYQWISTNYAQNPPKLEESRAHTQFYKFLDLVQKHYIEERGISFYADKMCITPKYLSNIVYRISGRHAGDWIKEYVILEAKALLKSHKYTVQEICDKLNFSNASFFGKYFKSTVGCSPRKYMNS